jgi:hypothetical protein
MISISLESLQNTKQNYNTCKFIYERGYHVLWNNVSFLGRILPLGDKTKEVQIVGRIFGENDTKLPYFEGKK